MIFDLYQIAIVALLVIFLIFPARVFGYLSGLSIFLYAQTAMGLGILPRLDPFHEADKVHANIILATLVAYVLTAIVAGVVRASRYKPSPKTIHIVRPNGKIWFLIAVSIAISALYFSAIGYIALIETIRGSISGTNVDAATLRIESYSGSSYYFPGYVNQFKNSLLPALVLITVHYLFHKKVSGALPLSIVLVAISMVFLLGTGQRGAFVKFVMIVIVYVLITNRKHFKAITSGIALFAISIFFISTAASGRASDELGSADSGLDRLIILFNQLIYRVTGSNQGSAVAGFRYIYERPTQYGHEWFLSIIGLLPGVSGSDLDSQIFATIYGGSTRGTSPPSVWGSIFYNFGEVGCIVIAVIFALILVKVSTLGSDAASLNTFQAVGLAGVNVISGSWIAGSPVYLFNFGLVVYILLWIYGQHCMKQKERPNIRKTPVQLKSSRGGRRKMPN